MLENEPRYFVDERGGCVAVRDRTRTDPDYPGLHHDTEGVVLYRHGKVVEQSCPTCGHKTGLLKLDPADVAECHRVAASMNAKPIDIGHPPLAGVIAANFGATKEEEPDRYDADFDGARK